MDISLFGKQFFINKILLFCIVIFLIIGSGILGYFLKQVYQPLSNSDIGDSKIIQTEIVEASDEIPIPEQEPEIKVYVIGCVNKPGVVTIKKGQVIDDAIRIAGGATKDADLENINLAYKLNENTMLRIKLKPVADSAASTKTSTKTSNNDQQNKVAVDTSKPPVVASKMNSGVDIITDSLEAVVIDEDENNDSKKNSLININKASQLELENLPNVGPATAKAIIDYRQKNDGFKKLTDIMKITGIKQKTYDKIKEFICIE